MRALIALLLIAIAVTQAITIQQEWNDYKEKFSKTYATVEEEEFRFKIFVESKKKIDEHNAKYEKGESTFKMGLNVFSDWTKEELKKLLGVIQNPKHQNN